mmetsp:Transcript_6048/g.12614  ORF Transcript_6048/g.12614 Transcript_6048/m.12614 type:complete len:188 (+) Transcript_6048:43-606(+)
MTSICPADGEQCSFEDCTCSNSSHVRELVNVSLDGRPCFACEPQRLPACTEVYDQCTPEACACANSRTHVKYNASTVDGSLCFYCEPVAGTFTFGRTEVLMAVLLVFLLALWRSGRQPCRLKATLRLPRRSGDQHRAIRVSQQPSEPLRFYEEVIQVVGDAFDAIVDGACELFSWPFRRGRGRARSA